MFLRYVHVITRVLPVLTSIGFQVSLAVFTIYDTSLPASLVSGEVNGVFLVGLIPSKLCNYLGLLDVWMQKKTKNSMMYF
jgi:hypothetical protein